MCRRCSDTKARRRRRGTRTHHEKRSSRLFSGSTVRGPGALRQGHRPHRATPTCVDRSKTSFANTKSTPRSRTSPPSCRPARTRPRSGCSLPNGTGAWTNASRFSHSPTSSQASARRGPTPKRALRGPSRHEGQTQRSRGGPLQDAKRHRRLDLLNLFNVNPVIKECDLLVLDDAHGAEQHVAEMWAVTVRMLRKGAAVSRNGAGNLQRAINQWVSD